MEYDEDDVFSEEEDDDMFSADEGMNAEDEAGYESDCNDFAAQSSLQKTYRVLLEADVKQLRDNGVEHIHSALSQSKDDALKLLYHYKWNESLLLDEWFDDEERVRKKVGLLSNPTEFRFTEQLITCGICFESFPLNRHHFYPTVCGHSYCIACWKDYLTVSIKDGPGCLSLRCPEPKCRAVVVDQDMVDELATEEERRKYAVYLFRSYVEENKKTKWCPAPGCENAVEFEIGSAVFDVTCLCSHAFCWNCVEEVHRPVDCKTVAMWVQKNSSESENTAWIIANSKPCPKCKKSIEKNHGCMHMTCKCRFEFCWLCLGPWSKHGERTGGNYNCNTYETAKKSGKYDEEEQRREMAKNNVERYAHYYERWASNHKSRQKAIEDLQNMQADLHKLSDRFKVTNAELVFLVNAWEQIIECRRVLKWTYAYGYYLPEHKTAKKTLFEYLQGEAEAGLERLHQYAEQQLDFLKDGMEPKYPKEVDPLAVDEEHQEQSKAKQERSKAEQEKLEEHYREFRLKLTDLTIVTRSYFENLVRALENDLSEVTPVSAKTLKKQKK
ncbi:hypothetical protein RND81_02G012300 [Saponaria officinalis]|uniref:RBR-type E3 ubiquitin transferase n=1 Tax=Saponaria officinalis TaxID=3572 RepID=A0AAW1MJD9_SAPOF